MLQHPYCRTCGSKLLAKNVCQHCGCEPLKGKYYCCDCGSPTIPEAIMCVECGAGFQRRFPATLAILIAGALLVAIAGAGYVIYVSNKNDQDTNSINSTGYVYDSSKTIKNNDKKNEVMPTIINRVPVIPPRKKNNAITELAKNIVPKNTATKPPKQNTKTEIIKSKNNSDYLSEVPTSRLTTNAISQTELRGHGAECTYFEGKNKNNIIFFTNNVFGYLKLNGRLYELRGIEKGNDIAKFSGSGYEVIIEIEGLAGSANEWVASATMTVKNNRQNVLARHRIYSSCTEF